MMVQSIFSPLEATLEELYVDFSQFYSYKPAQKSLLGLSTWSQAWETKEHSPRREGKDPNEQMSIK